MKSLKKMNIKKFENFGYKPVEFYGKNSSTENKISEEIKKKICVLSGYQLLDLKSNIESFANFNNLTIEELSNEEILTNIIQLKLNKSESIMNIVSNNWATICKLIGIAGLLASIIIPFVTSMVGGNIVESMKVGAIVNCITSTISILGAFQPKNKKR